MGRRLCVVAACVKVRRSRRGRPGRAVARHCSMLHGIVECCTTLWNVARAASWHVARHLIDAPSSWQDATGARMRRVPRLRGRTRRACARRPPRRFPRERWPAACCVPTRTCHDAGCARRWPRVMTQGARGGGHVPRGLWATGRPPGQGAGGRARRDEVEPPLLRAQGACLGTRSTHTGPLPSAVTKRSRRYFVLTARQTRPI